MSLIALIVINLIAITLCFVRTKHKTNYFFSGYLSAMSLGILASILDPVPIKHAVDQIILNQLVARFLASISYPFSPYFLLLAAFSLANIIPSEKRKSLALLLAVPIFIQYIYGFIFPKECFIYVYPDYSQIFLFIGLWGMIYVIAANLLVCYALIAERDRKARFHKLLVAILTFPTLFVTYQAYIVPIKGSHGFTSYTAQLGIFTFIAAAFFAIRFGFMGIRLVIGKDYLDSSIRSMTLGTSVMNHAIKNELQNINASISVMSKKPQFAEERALQLIGESTQHLQNIIKRIDFQIQEVILEKETCDLREILDVALDNLTTALNEKNITIEKKYENESLLYCDPVHLRECFINIIKNSMDAMNDGGKITVELLKKNRKAKIIISDSGMGIAKDNLPHILNPFFTTKTLQYNYGLGLSYCYKILQKHGGSIEISSAINQGTTVTLTLPNKMH